MANGTYKTGEQWREFSERMNTEPALPTGQLAIGDGNDPFWGPPPYPTMDDMLDEYGDGDGDGDGALTPSGSAP